MPGMRGNHGWLDRLDELGEMTRQLGALGNNFDRCGDRAAIGVSEHHYERHAEDLHPVFEAGEPVLVDEIAGDTHDENIARTLIEGELWGDAAVGAAQHRGDRILRARRGQRGRPRSHSRSARWRHSGRYPPSAASRPRPGGWHSGAGGLGGP